MLEKHINRFEWPSFEIIFSSQSHLTTCERFHDKFRGRRNLLFLFIGDQEIIGSFYREPYPSISEKYRKDPNSFIFIYDDGLPEKFAVYGADNQSEYHMTISEKLLICHGNTPNNGDGLRTFQRTLESLSYFLPSISFKSLNTSREMNYNGVLKIKEFYILQQLKEWWLSITNPLLSHFINRNYNVEGNGKLVRVCNLWCPYTQKFRR